MKYAILETNQARHQNMYFSKTKLFNLNVLCVCGDELEQSTTNLSFIFYLKTKILNLQT